ncbi:unnamed protein product, partial [Effrenium voratum]
MAADLQVVDFPHGGQQVRGLSSKAAIKKGQEILSVPQPVMLTDEFKLTEPRFKGTKSPLGLYLAELAKDPDAAAGKGNEVLSQWFRSLPTMQEAREAAIPLAAKEEELQPLQGLPRLAQLPQSVSAQRLSLVKDLEHYNHEVAKSGEHAALTFEEALWGAMMVRTRGFSCGEDVSVVAPVADLVNHSHQPNARWTCDSGKNAKLSLIAKEDIKPGEELLINYKAQSNPGAEVYFKIYGFTDGAKPEAWTSSECGKLQAAQLGGAPVLDRAKALVAEKCKLQTLEASM